MMLATRSFCSTTVLRRVCFFGSPGRKSRVFCGDQQTELWNGMRPDHRAVQLSPSRTSLHSSSYTLQLSSHDNIPFYC